VSAGGLAVALGHLRKDLLARLVLERIGGFQQAVGTRPRCFIGLVHEQTQNA
jgi:hypothetical protein